MKLVYDPDIYSGIIKTGRLVPLFTPSNPELKLLNQEEMQKCADKKVGEELVFTSKYRFDTTHLDDILRVHTPVDANAYGDECKDNVLKITFYKI